LKPANIFIVQRAEVPAAVKVLDFGIAKLAAESLDEDDPMTLTQIGVMIGTPRYMSPEQCDGLDLTPAADVYSLGCILYEMLTGTVPFSGSTPLAIAMKQTMEIPRSPREFVSSIPPALEKVVLHTLEKRPENRPANAAEFRKELLETAERLGLEHAAVSSSPNLAALRSVGTESPSGRLVIDISRLRETRANVDVNEITIVRPVAASVAAAGETAPQSSRLEPSAYSFPRVSLPLVKARWTNRQLSVIAVIIAAALLLAVVFALRARSGIVPEESVAASPSPTVEPTPSPSPSPTPTPAPKAPAKKAPVEPKKNSKGKSILNKMKRIFKNPF
jgi:serine/threonine-protein kinase